MADSGSSHSEEQEGFTFVDKRRVSSEGAETPDPAAASAETAAFGGEEADGADFGEQAPVVGDGGAYELGAYVVGLLSYSAWQYLGLVADPGTGSATRRLDQARVAIDSVAALVHVLDKPGSTLDPSTRQDLRRLVNDLRLNFVTQTQMNQESPGEGGQTA